MKPIFFTQDEANHVLLAVITREDLIDSEIQKASQHGNTSRIMELAKLKETLKNAENKLTDAGATLPF